MQSYARNSKIINKLRTKENVLSEANINRIKDYMDDIQCELDEAHFVDSKTKTRTGYVSVLEEWYGKLLEVVVAFKINWNKENQFQEVIRRVDGYEEILIKNLYFTNMCGYRVVWSSKQRASYYVWSPEYYNVWYPASYRNYRLYSQKLYKPEDVNKGKYKYLKWNCEGFLLDVLENYRIQPRNEILNSFGLQDLAGKTLNKMLNDDNFIKWIWKNHKDPNIYNLSIKELQGAFKRKYSPTYYFTYSNYYKFEKYGLNFERFKEYIDADESRSIPIYQDYLNACQQLGYNMKDTKTLFPKDLRRIHDLRMQELTSSKIKADAAKKADLSIRISKVAEKYKNLEFSLNGYAIILAKCVEEFLYEGEILHHCVGKMGYDTKMANDTTLILFVRDIKNINVPLVTVEYDPHNKRVLQSYAEHDTKPSESITNFVNTWSTQYAAMQLN